MGIKFKDDIYFCHDNSEIFMVFEVLSAEVGREKVLKIHNHVAVQYLDNGP